MESGPPRLLRLQSRRRRHSVTRRPQGRLAAAARSGRTRPSQIKPQRARARKKSQAAAAASARSPLSAPARAAGRGRRRRTKSHAAPNRAGDIEKGCPSRVSGGDGSSREALLRGRVCSSLVRPGFAVLLNVYECLFGLCSSALFSFSFSFTHAKRGKRRRRKKSEIVQERTDATTPTPTIPEPTSRTRTTEDRQDPHVSGGNSRAPEETTWRRGSTSRGVGRTPTR